MEFSQQNWSSIGVLVADLVYVGRVSGELEIWMVGRVESICVRETESEIIGTLVDTEGTVLVVSIRLWYW